MSSVDLYTSSVLGWNCYPSSNWTDAFGHNSRAMDSNNTSMKMLPTHYCIHTLGIEGAYNIASRTVRTHTHTNNASNGRYVSYVASLTLFGETEFCPLFCKRH